MVLAGWNSAMLCLTDVGNNLRQSNRGVYRRSARRKHMLDTTEGVRKFVMYVTAVGWRDSSRIFRKIHSEVWGESRLESGEGESLSPSMLLEDSEVPMTKPRRSRGSPRMAMIWPERSREAAGAGRRNFKSWAVG